MPPDKQNQGQLLLAKDKQLLKLLTTIIRDTKHPTVRSQLLQMLPWNKTHNWQARPFRLPQAIACILNDQSSHGSSRLFKAPKANRDTQISLCVGCLADCLINGAIVYSYLLALPLGLHGTIVQKLSIVYLSLPFPLRLCFSAHKTSRMPPLSISYLERRHESILTTLRLSSKRRTCTTILLLSNTQHLHLLTATTNHRLRRPIKRSYQTPRIQINCGTLQSILNAQHSMFNLIPLHNLQTTTPILSYTSVQPTTILQYYLRIFEPCHDFLPMRYPIILRCSTTS